MQYLQCVLLLFEESSLEIFTQHSPAGMSIREELENPTMPLAMGINTAEISVLEVKFKITSCPLRSKGVGVVGLFYHANS